MHWRDLLEPLLSLSIGMMVYLGTVAVIGLLLILRAYRSLHSARRWQIRLLRTRKVRLGAVDTNSPVDDPEKLAKKRAVANIEQYFTVTRRLLIPLIGGFTFVAMGLPLLRDLPAVFVTLVVTAMAVLLGIAARPVVENAIAGLVLSTSRLIRVGDTVRIEEVYGTVEDITLTHTTVKIWDWRRYVLPNSRVLQSSLYNYSLTDNYLWAYIEFWVAYDADFDEVERLAIEAAKQCPQFAPYEPPQLWVMDMQPSGYQCWLAAWADSPSDAWMLKAEMRTRLLRAFRERGIATQINRHVVGQTPPPAVGPRPPPAAATATAPD